MNKISTSKEDILDVCKKVVVETGIGGLNIRDIASKCDISIGTVYNYFPSKGDLVIETIKSIWLEIMHGPNSCAMGKSFVDSINSIFISIRSGCQKYPAFFSIHSMGVSGIDKDKGREMMDGYFHHIKNCLVKTLELDPNVNQDTFNDDFTKADFVDFVFANIMSLLLKDANSCDFLLEIIRRTIY